MDSPLFDCTDTPQTPEEEAFELQAPKPRRSTQQPPVYSPVVWKDDNTPYDSLDTDGNYRLVLNCTPGEYLYHQWLQTGNISTRRTKSHYGHRAEEIKDIIAAYGEALKLLDNSPNPQINDFCDALTDSMAEFLDEFSLDFFKWETLFGLPTNQPCVPLLQLVAFYSVLTSPGIGFVLGKGYENSGYNAAQHRQRKFLRDTVTTGEIWHRFLRSGRCRFHGHASGRCWREDYEPARPSLWSPLLM